METYTYYYRLRPPGIGCQPSDGLVSFHAADGKTLIHEGYEFWGTAEYSRILTDEEVTRFDLYCEFHILDWKYKAIKQKFNHIIGGLNDKKTAVQITNKTRYAIVHPHTNQEGWQISFFDELGASGHTVARDKKSIVSELMDYGYKPDEFEYAV